MSPLDLLLLVMVLIWGTNFTLVKVAMRDFPELAFNGGRLVVASTIYLVAMWRLGDWPRGLSRAEWQRLIVLGVVGTLFYQLCFLAGVRRTSVGNASLITGSAPVVIAVLSSLAGHERIPPIRWLGVLLALVGLYLVVGHQANWTGESRIGDLLMIASMFCWAAYSVAARPILQSRSALLVTGTSFAMGSALYLTVTLPMTARVDYGAIGAASWVAMVASGAFALAVAYLIWYTGVQRLGTTRTAVYNYLTPIVAALVAALWLGEGIHANQVAGAGAILTGLALTRFARGGMPDKA